MLATSGEGGGGQDRQRGYSSLYNILFPLKILRHHGYMVTSLTYV